MTGHKYATQKQSRLKWMAGLLAILFCGAGAALLAPRNSSASRENGDGRSYLGHPTPIHPSSSAAHSGDLVQRVGLSAGMARSGAVGSGGMEGTDPESAGRAESVKAAMARAWRGYARFAMGAPELRPVSRTANLNVMGGVGISDLGVTVVDAMSTLHIMGLQEEFERARDWLSGSLHFEKQGLVVSFFEITIRLLGGLVSCYDLSGDAMFLEKAADLGNRLLRNFPNYGTGLPAAHANLESSRGPTSNDFGSLAELGSNILEFGALALRTGRPEYLVKAEKGIRRMHRCNPNALLSVRLDGRTGRSNGGSFSVGAEADSYYEYLLKYWILTGKQDDHWRRRWEAAVDESMSRLVPTIRADPSLAFTAILSHGALNTEVWHLTCFWPGSIALGVMHGAVHGDKAEHYMHFAESMTRACYQLYNTTATGLGAERVSFDRETGQPTFIDARYLQRPEVIESIFYLYRATKNPMYRDWGWTMFQAFERHCSQEAGYAGVDDVNEDPPKLHDAQQSWLLAETFKYWYLLFSPDSAFSLEDWVLNTEAHPLRVWVPNRGRASSGGARFFQAAGEEEEESEGDGDDGLLPCDG